MENNNTTDTTQSAVSASVPLSDIFFMTLHHWPWIIVSLVVCLGFAYLYILRTPKVYTRSAEVLIKEQNKGRTAGMEDFSTMGLFQSKTNIVNEISTMQAKDLMTEVVSRLGLDYNYYRKGTFHNQLLYGPDLPVHAVVAGLGEEDAVEFSIQAWSSAELARLFKHFCEENRFKNVLIDNVYITQAAETWRELV